MSVELKHSVIDHVHSEMTALIQNAATANREDYFALFNTLVTHTEEHFAYEEDLMKQSGYPHSAEHIADHRQILNEMKQFESSWYQLSHSYMTERLPERIRLHVTRLDSQLVAWINSHQ